MALNQLGLGFLFTAKDLASGTMNKIRGNFGQLSGVTAKESAAMGKAFAGVSTGLGIMTAGFGTLAVGLESANAFGKFEQGLASVKAVTKASAKEYDLLKKSAINAGIATQFSPDEAAEGLLSLATAGQTAQQATETLIPVLDLAAGSLGQLGVGQAANAVVGTLNAYGIAADQATGVTDKLLRITQLTNFQTKDFEGGLAKAAASGATFGQSMDDVLITMGLLRNRNIDASSSATAFREATRRLGSDQRAQQAITDAGVDIFDKTTGEMRSLIDITKDFEEATTEMTAEQRNAAVVQAYGARGLLAFNAIQTATFTTMKDGQQVTLKGRDALAALRKEIGNAEGTAAGFRAALLDTFEGQKTLMKGSMQTLSVVAGEAFAQTFKPVVSVLIQGLNLLIQVITNTPAPLKKIVVAAIGVLGTFMTLGGGAIFVTASIMLILPVLKLVAIALGAMALAALPLIAALGVIAFAFYGFQRAAKTGILGPTNDLADGFAKVELAAKALGQFFSDGEISGAIAKDLLKAENSGVFNFVDSIVRTFQNVRNFFKGVFDGFDKGLVKAIPAIEQMKKALGDLFKTIGSIFGEGSDATKGEERFKTWGEKGSSVGEKLSKAFIVVVKAIALAATATDITIKKMQELGPAVKPIAKDLKDIAATFGDLDMGGPGSESTDGWAIFGAVVKFTIKVAITAVRLLISVVKQAANAFVGSFNIIMAVAAMIVGVFKGAFQVVGALVEGDWKGAMKGMLKIAITIVRGIVNVFGQLVLFIAKSIDTLGSLVGKDVGAGKKVSSVLDSMNAGIDKFEKDNATVEKKKKPGDTTGTGDGLMSVAPEPILYSVAPNMSSTTDANLSSGGGGANMSIADLNAQLSSLTKATDNLSKEKPATKTNIKLELDGQVLKELDVESKDTGFSPGGAPAGN